jgi:hypothetical protein
VREQVQNGAAAERVPPEQTSATKTQRKCRGNLGRGSRCPGGRHAEARRRGARGGEAKSSRYSRKICSEIRAEEQQKCRKEVERRGKNEMINEQNRNGRKRGCVVQNEVRDEYAAAGQKREMQKTQEERRTIRYGEIPKRRTRSERLRMQR